MRASPLLAVLVAACGSVPMLPEGEGQGLVAVDDVPPPGVTLVERPQWSTGDRFVFLRGGAVRQSFTVEASGEGYRLVDEESGMALGKDLDFGDVYQDREGFPGSRVELAPADTRYSWPLWVGKTWTCHYLRKTPGESLPLIVTYEVEAEETLDVPAGSFRCLRILRSARPAVEGDFYPQYAILWYAPEAGIDVRWITSGLLTELAEHQRQ